MARGCLWLSINAKQSTSWGKEDISLFISLISFFLSFFCRAYINFESRGEEGGPRRKEEQMKSIFRMLETSGFIFQGPERKLQNGQNSYVLIYFIIREAEWLREKPLVVDMRLEMGREGRLLTGPRLIDISLNGIHKRWVLFQIKHNWRASLIGWIDGGRKNL